MDMHARLAALGLRLPEASAPVANYVPYVRSGGLVFVSGQISKVGDDVVRGRLGEDLSVEDGQRAARLCALNILAQLGAACGGDWSRLRRIVKLGGFVQATADATGPAIPQVINGASDLLVDVLGERGRHARFAVSAPSLPLDVAVEIDCIAEVDPG